jgi:hypothetical protein
MTITYAELKLLTSDGRSPSAVQTIAANTGIDIAAVRAMVSWGAARIEAEVAKIKATQPASMRRDAVIAAARGAWLVASASVTP